MVEKQDLAPIKIRLKDNYRERIFAESQKLDKSYLETLYFIIDCYFVFVKAGIPIKQVAFTPLTSDENRLQQPTFQPSTDARQEDSDDQTFTLDFEL